MESTPKSVMSNEDALKQFLLDIDCLDELLPWTGRFNIFDVLKVSRTEIRHSNMLGWLLDANENHGLGDGFVRGLLQRLAENDTQGRYNVFDILLLDFYSFLVLREWKNIDLLMVSDKEKTLVAIENKVGSHEHSNQLNRYREILEREYPDYKRIYIFLTPDGEAPSDEENWDVLTYTDVVDILDVLQKKVELQPDVALMIRNYLEIVRRDIVEDRELIEICNKIYNKHKKALDLIFEHCSTETDKIAEAVTEALSVAAEQDKICYDTSCNPSYVFYTKRMNAFLPQRTDKKGAWGHGEMYRYWIAWQGQDIYASFELGGWDVSDATMEHMQALIDLLKPKDKKRYDFRYKRLYTTKKYTIKDGEDGFETTTKIVSQLVDDLLSMENRVLKELI